MTATLPLAADPTDPTPGFWLTIDLLRSSTSPGTSQLKCCILSPRATGQGDITDDTEIRPVYSADDVKTAAGRCLGYFAYKALFDNDPDGPVVDLVCPTEATGDTAAGTLTFAAAPTSNMVFRIWIMGHPILTTWDVGEAVTDERDTAVDAINQYVDDLFCVASAGTGGVVDLDANSAGVAGNDVRIRVEVVSGAGGTCTAGAATLTLGTTEPDFTTALSTIEGKEYDYILPCLSNAEAQSASTTNQSRVEDHINSLKSGRNAKLQQAHIASSGTFAQAITGSVGCNSEYMTHLCFENSEDLPCEIAGADCGDRMFRRGREKNANRCLEQLAYLRGAADKVANDPSPTESKAALNAGVSVGGYTANGDPLLLRSVTTHSQDAGGNPDKRCFDTNEPDAIFEVGKDMRSYIPQTFFTSGSQVKIARDVVDGSGVGYPPKGVVEERDVKSAITKRIRDYWVPEGVVDGVEFDASDEAGEFIVRVNDSDETQVDVFMPAKPFKILSKIGMYLAKVG
jgi:phage tail sheath gpL-like